MTPVINPQTTEEIAIEMLEEARNVVERHFYELRDEVLDSDQLFTMRIALQDACDTIMLATRHIEKLQREVEATEPKQD
jgi:hypothetical protein